MNDVWVLCATFEHESKPAKIEPFTHVLFVSEQIAEQYLQSQFGDEVAATATEDTQTNPDLDGYWLGDIDARSIPLGVICALYD